MDYLKLRRGYASALYHKIISSTGAPVSLLDIATGPGTVVMGLRPSIREAVGIDTDPERIADANKIADEYVRFSCLPIEKFDSEKQFDLVTIAQAFESLPESSYKHIFRYVRPGGTVAVFWKYPDLTTPASKLFGQAVKPREYMLPQLKSLDLETKLAPFHLSLETYSEFRSEESFKLEDWIQSSLWDFPDKDPKHEEALRSVAPKYVTETFVNYLWLFRKN